MALFDPEHRRLIIRLVYDGPAFAGKTTNMAQLCNIFPVERRTELYTPGALKGRTLFFDWLEVDGGLIGSYPVRCQLLSVPGQARRSYRRRPLVKSADTVVFVCDSDPSQLDESRRSFALLRRYLRERQPEKVPFAVQANKQDGPAAMTTAQLGHQLRLPPEVPVLPACASMGVGVRETVITALRMALHHVQHRVAREGLGAILGAPQTADELLDALLVLEDEAPEEEVVTPEELAGGEPPPPDVSAKPTTRPPAGDGGNGAPPAGGGDRGWWRG
ncbi:MAG TPA: ADP-ribosylation factor-like protein [Polyangiaceae bacterium]|nr:ADP-ribosylation factor-like protein [Polyangiaceae bacterium]